MCVWYVCTQHLILSNIHIVGSLAVAVTVMKTNFGFYAKNMLADGGSSIYSSEGSSIECFMEADDDDVQHSDPS